MCFSQQTLNITSKCIFVICIFSVNSGASLTVDARGAPEHRTRETVNLLKQETSDFITPTLLPPNSPDLNPVECWLRRVENSTGSHLQEPDKWHGRDAPVHQGRVWWSWSASDWLCSRGMAQETASLHCSWWGTLQTRTVNMNKRLVL